MPRPKNREGGGVAIIFKSTISVKVLDSTDIPEKGIPGLEYMECEIKIKKKKHTSCNHVQTNTIQQKWRYHKIFS